MINGVEWEQFLGHFLRYSLSVLFSKMYESTAGHSMRVSRAQIERYLFLSCSWSDRQMHVFHIANDEWTDFPFIDIEVRNICRFLTENATSGVTLISCTSSVGCMPSKSPDIESKCCSLDSYPVQHAEYILRWTHSPTNRRSESHATTMHRWCFATMAKWIFLCNRSFCRCFLQLFCFQPLDTNHACSLIWSLKYSAIIQQIFYTPTVE
jgi:hypothetical protein